MYPEKNAILEDSMIQYSISDLQLSSPSYKLLVIPNIPTVTYSKMYVNIEKNQLVHLWVEIK